MILHKGDVLFRQGEEGPLYFVESGLLKIVRLDEDGSMFLFNIITSGETIPHHSLLSPKEYHGTAIALVKTTVQLISPSDWYERLHDDSKAYYEVALQLQAKLRIMQQRIDHLTASSPKERMERLQCWFASHVQNAHLTDILNQTEISQLLGLRRETVNRILREQKKSSV
ncbi:Crp/Fnr family transcriptional regulator [Ectobacillus sp. JY-23]|uniref:Crp/Fnr family transcriptional regulator n=1 Tax=Ectobacillus sp. JY-23 TaxID=2933872 RepID=UPI001FF2957F|nr:Crp/Fnr family transcriptional regulator [Ectobacillus sp. JY-23]UOY93531.1 Crp/Fnr family transcriptional regulator [Ectobacillus sp. JY-23]